MKKMTIFPWYIFLLPLFYILHIYNDYFGIFNITIALQFLAYYLLLSIALFLVAFLVYKNIAKASILTILVLIFFFFFGAIHDFLKSLRLPSFLVSYTFLLPLAMLSFIVLIVRLKKNKCFSKSKPVFQVSFYSSVFYGSGYHFILYFFKQNKKHKPHRQ